MSITRASAFIAALVLLLATAVACGGDDGGSDGGDAEAFCERLVELDEDDQLDLDEEAAFDAFDELVELAPEEIDSDLERIRDAFEELSSIDEDDPEAFGAAFEIILDPAVASALEDFAGYAEDECGVEVEGANLDEGLTDDFSADFSDDFSDDRGGDDEEDDLSTSERLRAYLDENHPDFSDLASGIGSAQLGESAVDMTLTLDETVDEDTAVEICEATVDFADEDGLSEIDIEVEDQQDTVLATGDQDGCEAS